MPFEISDTFRVSIHARPRGARRRPRTQRPCPWRTVSIHARPRGARRPLEVCADTLRVMFQSTPGPEGPGDVLRSGHPSGSMKFQSTPGPEGPGDSPSSSTCKSGFGFQSTPGPEGPGDGAGADRGACSQVSIHARPRGARRRRGTRATCRPGDRFNPRPAPRGQATSPIRLLAITICFNPRPAPRGQATGARGTGAGGYRVSIHARPRGARRHGPHDISLWQQYVSIHARPRGARRHRRLCAAPPDAGFQSTPGPEGPGDLRLGPFVRFGT